MAIAIHSVKLSNVAGTNITISCDLSSTAYRFCVVCSQGTWSGTPTSVTCGGDAMTEQIRRDYGGYASAIHVLKAHKTGTQNVVVNFASSCNNVITVLSLRNVNQTTPVSYSNYYEGASGNASGAATTSAGDFVVDSLSFMGDYGAGLMTVGAGQTQLHNYNYTTGYCAGAASYEVATGASTTMSWTRSGTNGEWCLTLATIEPSAAEDNGRRKHFVS